MILDELAAHARERIVADKAKIPLEDMKAQAEALPKGDFRFEKALSGKECAFICEVKKALEAKGFRCEIDDRNEKIGYKIREAQLEKVPYMVLVGDKDVENNTVSIRKRKGGDLGAMSLEAFLEKIIPERDNRVIE